MISGKNVPFKLSSCCVQRKKENKNKETNLDSDVSSFDDDTCNIKITMKVEREACKNSQV